LEKTLGTIKIFVCGDVMTGRGIDQVLPCPSNPVLHEPYITNAKEYVKLAELKNGPIPKPANFSYVWGDALSQLERMAPDLRIINLETSVTKSDEYWRGKEIHYRMNPENVPCITAAKVDYCSLANNHVLDWGYPGLTETLDTLAKARIKTSGAGENAKKAESPAVLEVEGKGRAIVFSVGSETSGIPQRWAASESKPGINLIEDLSDGAIRNLRKKVEEIKVLGDIVIASIHWGANWGYNVPLEQQEFARKLIDEAKVDLIHGHSSHHLKGIEVYKDKLILYGCGDFLNDYEGIGGYESFRSDLCLMYFASVEVGTGKLLSLEMMPMQIKRFRVNKSSRADAMWVRNTLEREEKKFGCFVELKSDNTLSLKWNRK